MLFYSLLVLYLHYITKSLKSINLTTFYFLISGALPTNLLFHLNYFYFKLPHAVQWGSRLVTGGPLIDSHWLNIRLLSTHTLLRYLMNNNPILIWLFFLIKHVHSTNHCLNTYPLIHYFIKIPRLLCPIPVSLLII